MKQEVMKIWVDALRSGEYWQGHLQLKTITHGEVTHCCLGVLCELYNKHTDEPLIETINDDHCSFDYYSVSLPPVVQVWAGMESNDGRFPSGNLSSLNDEGKPFEQIAKVIEENVERL